MENAHVTARTEGRSKKTNGNGISKKSVLMPMLYFSKYYPCDAKL